MPPMTKKADKASVNYRMGGPECGACDHYSEDETVEEEGAEPNEGESGWCQIVKGRIDEQGVCDKFRRRNPTLEYGGSTEDDEEE